MEQHLGIYITQVANAAAKANSMLGRIKNFFTFKDPDKFVTLSKMLVHCHMENCIHGSLYLGKTSTHWKLFKDEPLNLFWP